MLSFQPSAKLSITAQMERSLQFGAALLLGGILSGVAPGKLARAQAEPCAPPMSGEYLLLVVVQGQGAQDKLNQVLPPSVKAPTCDYLGTPVARMGGFRKPEDADAWASYLREVAALPAFIAEPSQEGAASAASPPTTSSPSTAATAQGDRPTPRVSVPDLRPRTEPQPQPQTRPSSAAPASSNSSTTAASDLPRPNLQPQPQTRVSRYPNATVTVPPLDRAGSASGRSQAASAQTAQSRPNQAASNSTLAYSPQQLGSGYAVLVDYASQPELAAQVQAVLGQPVGLASYGQRPYLLAEFSADSAIAIATLRRLSQGGFNSLLVDSQGVTVLRSRVR